MSDLPNQPNGAWGAPAGDDAAQAAPVAPRKPASTITRSTLALCGLFALAVAGIWLMHVKAKPSEASAAVRASESKMEEFLQTVNLVRASAKETSAQGVVETFQVEARQRQVPAKDLRNNPFCLVLPAAAPEPKHEEEASEVAPPPDPEAEALSVALVNIKGLWLQSVLTGSAGATAVISNNLLTVGQKINGWTVIEIQPRQVVLEWKGHRHTLTMK